VIEPSGASALAAAIAHGATVLNSHSRVGVILSGGNVDVLRFASLVDKV
jgi:threonine dehydratase